MESTHHDQPATPFRQSMPSRAPHYSSRPNWAGPWSSLGTRLGKPRSGQSFGDYTARMHRRIKARMKEIDKGYQYPRTKSCTL